MFFLSSRRRHTSFSRDWSSDVCSSDLLGFLSFLFGDPMPRFWAEGLAQYETEVWDAQRGERWLRTAVLDDRLSYNDGRSVWNGQIGRASGREGVYTSGVELECGRNTKY